MTRIPLIGVVVLFGMTALMYASNKPDTDSGADRKVSASDIRELEQQLSDAASSNVEAIFGFHSESGDLNNKLDFWRAGGRLNWRRDGGTTFYLQGVRTSYSTTGNVLNAFGTSFLGGMKTVLSDRSTARVEIGATQFSTHATTINGLGSLELKQSESTSLTFTASRSNVEESLLSAAGVRPATGPYAGKLVGEVMDNRGVVALRHAFTPRFDVNASGGAGLRTGNSIESNFFKILDGSAGYNLISRPEEASLSLLRVSYAVDYIGFAKNLFGYGGASLLGQDGQPIPPNALGSDGMSTSPSPDTAGTGGYFSPSMFLNDGARVEVQGRANRSVELRASGFIGSQRYTGTSPHAAEGISGTAIVRLNQRLSVPVTYGWDNFGPFRQDSLLVRLVAKF